MNDVQIKGTVARVEYHIRKSRVLHIMSMDGHMMAVRLSWKMEKALPSNILGAEVRGTAYEVQPGEFISNYLPMIEPDTQPLLSVERPIVVFDPQEAQRNRQTVADIRGFGFDIAESPLVGTGADLVVSSRIGVQMKWSLDDLCGSVSDGRLFSEVEELETCYEIPLLLLVGTQADRSHMNPASVEGSLAYLITAFDRLRIIHRPDRPSACLLIRSLVRREQTEGRHYPVLKEWKRTEDLDEAKLRMIAQIPAVGGKTAQRLLHDRKTVEGVVTMPEPDWEKYVPKARRKDVEKVLREPVI